MFVDPGVKVNGQYYRDVLLSHQMIPAIKLLAGDMFVFQQDSALVHHANDTIQLLQRETPDFIGPDLWPEWPPNSPDLNPVDYKIWGVSSGCESRVNNVDEFEATSRLARCALCSRTSLTWLSASGDSD